jgi:hypothetical protein
MPLDAIKSLLHAIKAPILHRDLRLKMRKLRLQVRQIHLKTGHSNFEVSNLPAHFVAQRSYCGLQSLLTAPEDVQLLHDKIGGFVGHVAQSSPNCPINPLRSYRLRP